MRRVLRRLAVRHRLGVEQLGQLQQLGLGVQAQAGALRGAGVLEDAVGQDGHRVVGVTGAAAAGEQPDQERHDEDRGEDDHEGRDAAAVGASLIAFILVYFTLFGAGIFYILRLMGEAPHVGEPGLPADEPIRAAGIMPGPVMDEAGRAQPAE